MNPPAGSDTSDGNLEIGAQLRAWWKTHRRERVYDSSAGFYLSDGSLLSPDAAYLSAETFSRLTAADHKGFPHICPDFIVELLSRTDRLADVEKKIQRWNENGVQLGWLVDPYARQVLVYMYADAQPTAIGGAAVEGSGPVESFRLDLSEVWDCYDI